MDKQAGRKENQFLRKIITVIFLPVISFIWMTGWTLNVIGETVEYRESSKKTLRIHPRFESHVKDFEPLAEERKIANEPQIVA